MQYSLFAHGTSLRIENAAALAGSSVVGWGTVVSFKPPLVKHEIGNDPKAEGPGSWFHISLPSTLTTFGRRAPELLSTTLLFDASHCSITRYHVYDGAEIIHESNGGHSSGEFLFSRNSFDINPEVIDQNPQVFSNTTPLGRPRVVFAAIGISFYACQRYQDLYKDGYGPDWDHPETFPKGFLTISGAGGQFHIKDDLSFLVSRILEAGKVFTKAVREP